MSRAEAGTGILRPPGFRRAAFTTARTGDVRTDPAHVASLLGIPADWAVVRQVHADTVAYADRPGVLGEADAIFTDRPGLPVVVFTADCAGVVIEASDAVGVAHAGWRGAAAGVVEALVEAMIAAGHEPQRAAIGPTIGPCCFEVGPEVAQRFPGYQRTTAQGTTSVDLPAAIAAQLPGVEVWTAPECTRCSDDRYHSHRRNGTAQRMAAIGWLS